MPAGYWSLISPGKRLTVHRHNTEYFILHRTAEQIAAARAGDGAAMPSPESDSERVRRPEWLLVEASRDGGYFYPPRYRNGYRGRSGGWF